LLKYIDKLILGNKMTQRFYTAMALSILLLWGCADAGKNETIQANSKVYLDTSKTHTDMGGKITQYNWEALGDYATKIHIFNNGTRNASFTAPNVSKKTSLAFKLTTVESYKCKTRLDSSCRHHRSTDRIKFTVEPHKAGESNSTNTGSKNTINLSGKITTTDNQAIAGATVIVDSKKSSTGNDGSYRLSNLNAIQRTIIHVSHPDYFNNSRVILVNQKGNYTQNITLNKGKSNKTFQAKEGSTLIHNNASVSFEAGTYTTANNKKYTGTIHANLSYNNLKTTQDKNAFVGPYEKTDGSNSLPLIPYALIQIAINNDKKEALTPASNTVIKLLFPKSDTQSNEASLPLWFYDKHLGYWVKKGTAILTNNQYIAEVHQAGTWGLFAQPNKASLEVCVKDADGVALSGANIHISASQWQANLIQTNSDGHATLSSVPAATALTIKADKKINNKTLRSTYAKSVTLIADENKYLSDCITLGKKTNPKPTDNNDSNETDNNTSTRP